MTTSTPTYDSANFLGPNPGLNRLYDNIQAIVPALQFPVLQMVVWNIIEDFYMFSTWKREHIYWEMQPGQQSVDFNPFSATWLVSDILGVDGLPNFRISPPGTLIDRFSSSSLRKGHVDLALKPVSLAAIASNQFADDALWSKHFDTLCDGVYWKLFSMPAKPWSSPQMAQYHGARYRQGRARAKGEAQTHYAGASGASWRFPVFASGRRKN